MDVSHSSKAGMDSQKKTRKRIFSKNRNYKSEALSSALNAIKNGELTISRAALQYGIPKSTLRSHIVDHVPTIGAFGGCAPALPANLEQDLVDWLHARNEMGARVGWQELASAVKELHSDLNVTACASALPSKKLQQKLPSSGWLVRFRKRHPNVPILRTKKEDWYPPSKFSASTMQEWILKLDKRLKVSAQSSVSKLFSHEQGNIFNLGLVTFCQNSLNISISWDLDSENSFAQLLLCFSVNCIIKPVLLIKEDMLPHWQKYSTLNESPFDVMASDKLFNSNIFRAILDKIVTQQGNPSAGPTLILFDKSLACVNVDVSKFAQDNGIVLHCFPLHSSERQPHYFGPLRKMVLQGRKLSVCDSEEGKFQLISHLWSQELKSENWTATCFETCGLSPLSEMYREALQVNDQCSCSTSSTPEFSSEVNLDVVRGMQMALNVVESRCIDSQYLPVYRDFFARNLTPKNDPMYSTWRELKLELTKVSSIALNQDASKGQALPIERKLVYASGKSLQSDGTAAPLEATLKVTEKGDTMQEPQRSTAINNAPCELRDSVPISDRYKREFNFDSMPALNLEQHALEIMEQYEAMAGSGQLQQLVIDADRDFEPSSP